MILIKCLRQIHRFPNIWNCNDHLPQIRSLRNEFRTSYILPVHWQTAWRRHNVYKLPRTISRKNITHIHTKGGICCVNPPYKSGQDVIYHSHEKPLKGLNRFWNAFRCVCVRCYYKRLSARGIWSYTHNNLQSSDIGAIAIEYNNNVSISFCWKSKPNADIFQSARCGRMGATNRLAQCLGYVLFNTCEQIFVLSIAMEGGYSALKSD